MPPRDCPPECPIDLCSHRRSGTHFLAATLHLNFDLGDLELRTVVPGGRRFRNGDREWGPGERAVIPWGKLWASHHFYNQRWRDLSRCLYIARDPINVLMSRWRFVDPEMKDPTDKHVGIANVLFWRKHVNGYLKGGVHIVRYEDLAGPAHDRVLAGIAERFGLKRRRRKYVRLADRVGWYPDPAPLQPKQPPAELLGAVQLLIPRGQLGYSLNGSYYYPEDDRCRVAVPT